MKCCPKITIFPERIRDNEYYQYLLGEILEGKIISQEAYNYARYILKKKVKLREFMTLREIVFLR